MPRMNEAQYDVLCRMTQSDNLDGLAAAFRSLAGNDARAAALAIVADSEPELPKVSNGGGFV